MVSWWFKVEGQPPSVNRMYTLARTKSTGRPYLTKSLGVEMYQLVASSACRQARPKDWEPAPKIRLRYMFHVKRDIDCDNAMKALNDAIAIALGVNDRTFLPCTVDKTTGNKEPHVIVVIENAT
jgi:Holliday junction resolvase RusA-like endonuclease